MAETAYTCFAGSTDPVTVRLVVRRVRPTPGTQLALFTDWDYHALVTDRPGDMLQVEADHRRHAVVEQTIAELKAAELAHLPSGKFTANAAWLALGVMAHNLGRAGALAGHNLDRATVATQAPETVRHPRPPRSHRPPTAPPAPQTMAMGRSLRHRDGRDHRHPDAPLKQKAPIRPQPEGQG